MGRIRRTRKVSVSGTITAAIHDGEVTPADLAAWVRAALCDYHRFRLGYVGTDCAGGILVPEMVCHDEQEESDSESGEEEAYVGRSRIRRRLHDRGSCQEDS